MKAALIFSLFFAPTAFAQVLRGTIASSLGGAGVAGIHAAEGGLLNPALVTIYPGSGVDGMYRDGSAIDGQHRHVWSVGAIDNSKESLFSGAIHYARTSDLGRVEGPVRGELYHGSFGYRLDDHLAVGVTAYRLSEKVRTGSSRVNLQWNWDLGALVMFTPSFGFGYTIRNLAHPSGDIPRPLRQWLNQTGGIYVGIGEIARLRVDLGRREQENPHRQLVYMVGLETRMREVFLLRFGFRHDEAGDGKVVSAGLSLDGPKLKIDYAMEKSTEHASGALHSVDMRIPF